MIGRTKFILELTFQLESRQLCAAAALVIVPAQLILMILIKTGPKFVKKCLLGTNSTAVSLPFSVSI